MDKYIVELLKTSNRIIIPELGAFITKKEEPGVIVFNEFLKFNDGIFVSHVAEKEKIDKEEALQKTESFVKEIFDELEKGKAHVIKNFGEFQKDEKGKIQFIPASAKKAKETPKTAKEEVKATPEAKPKEKADVEKELKEKKAEEEKKKAEEVKKDEEDMSAEALAKEEEKKAEEKAEEDKKKAEKKKEEEMKKVEDLSAEALAKAEEKKTEEAKKAEEKKKADEPEKVKAAPVVTPEEQKDLIEIQDDEQEEETEVEEKEDREAAVIYAEKKKANPLLWLALALIPIIILVVWFVFLRDGKTIEPDQVVVAEPEQKEEITAEQPAVVDEDTKKTESAVQEEQTETVAEEPTEPVVEEEVTEPVTPAGKQYYIVAGCFEKEENADNYVTLLSGKGFNAEKFGMLGRLHAVSFTAFPTKPEAIAELKNIRETTEPNAWLLYY